MFSSAQSLRNLPGGREFRAVALAIVHAQGIALETACTGQT